MGKTTPIEAPGSIAQEQITIPQLNRGKMVRLGFEITPPMYRNLVRCSRKMMGRDDLAAVCRMFLKKGVFETIDQDEGREVD